MSERQIRQLSGTCIVLPGSDIDTDRIIPARFLTTLSFEGLGDNVFANDREHASTIGDVHPFDEPSARGATIMVVEKNFGCGSSREHAPQALLDWGAGISGIVGESFGDIFRDNCTKLGIVCVTAALDTLSELRSVVRQRPDAEISLELARRTIEFGGRVRAVGLPEATRISLLAGTWSPTIVLCEAAELTREVAQTLPYINWAPSNDDMMQLLQGPQLSKFNGDQHD